MDREAIEVSGTYRMQDFWRFRMYSGLRFIWPVVLLLLALAAMLLLLGLLGGGANAAASLEAAGVMLLWTALLVLPQHFVARRQFAAQPALREPVNFRLDSEGMHSRTSAGAADASWKRFHSVRETGSLFILYTAPNLGNLLPKRFFASGGELAEFRAMVERGIAPKRIRRPGIWSRWW